MLSIAQVLIYNTHTQVHAYPLMQESAYAATTYNAYHTV